MAWIEDITASIKYIESDLNSLYNEICEGNLSKKTFKYDNCLDLGMEVIMERLFVIDLHEGLFLMLVGE